MDKSAATQLYRIVINASAQAIWDAITLPEWTEKYGYGGRVEYELKASQLARPSGSKLRIAEATASARQLAGPDMLDGRRYAGISSNAISTNGRPSDAKTPDYPDYGTCPSIWVSA
jgi:hypothetical protein